MPLDRDIDRLYQLPLSEFTKARDALAKEHADRRADIKQLQKPNTAAWAVNQLHWRERGAYEALIAASEKLRKAQMASLTGKSADVPAAEAAHAAARRAAVERVRKILEAAGEPASPATLTAITETLDALPTDDQPGRLVKPLKPAGFEALTGLLGGKRIAAKPAPVLTFKKPEAAKPSAADERKQKEKEEKALRELTAKARDAAAADKEAVSALARAKAALDKARKTREKAEQELADATERVSQLERDVRDAERRANQSAIAKATAQAELEGGR